MSKVAAKPLDETRAKALKDNHKDIWPLGGNQHLRAVGTGREESVHNACPGLLIKGVELFVVVLLLRHRIEEIEQRIERGVIEVCSLGIEYTSRRVRPYAQTTNHSEVRTRQSHKEEQTQKQSPALALLGIL